MMNNAAAQPIWDFVLGYYRQAGVSEAAIALQDSATVPLEYERAMAAGVGIEKKMIST